MTSPLISVIIPVFNAQDVLPAAMDSVFRQNIPDMEIILVNDGSRDGSLRVCESYAQSEPCIRIINQKNGGPSAARNAGLKLARGRFLSFVDSDDTLVPGAYARMLDAVQASDAQMAIAHFNFIRGSKAIDRGLIQDDVVLSKDAFMGVLAQRPGSSFYSVVWNKLYSRELVGGNGIFFDTACKWGEDFHFNLRCYRYINRVAFVKQSVYNYRRTFSGQAWRTVFRRPYHILAVKARNYRTLKGLYLHTGHYRQYRAQITRYIFDIIVSK